MSDCAVRVQRVSGESSVSECPCIRHGGFLYLCRRLGFIVYQARRRVLCTLLAFFRYLSLFTLSSLCLRSVYVFLSYSFLSSYFRCLSVFSLSSLCLCLSVLLLSGFLLSLSLCLLTLCLSVFSLSSLCLCLCLLTFLSLDSVVYYFRRGGECLCWTTTRSRSTSHTSARRTAPTAPLSPVR